jgi:hypothetical protein
MQRESSLGVQTMSRPSAHLALVGSIRSTKKSPRRSKKSRPTLWDARGGADGALEWTPEKGITEARWESDCAAGGALGWSLEQGNAASLDVVDDTKQRCQLNGTPSAECCSKSKFSLRGNLWFNIKLLRNS